jgi:hypothetical protein
MIFPGHAFALTHLENTMKSKVTEKGVLIPKRLLEGVEEVEIRKENGLILVVPVSIHDPVFDIGKNPLDDDITDAARNHDRYLYGSN